VRCDVWWSPNIENVANSQAFLGRTIFEILATWCHHTCSMEMQVWHRMRGRKKCESLWRSRNMANRNRSWHTVNVELSAGHSLAHCFLSMIRLFMWSELLGGGQYKNQEKMPRNQIAMWQLQVLKNFVAKESQGSWFRKSAEPHWKPWRLCITTLLDPGVWKLPQQI